MLDPSQIGSGLGTPDSAVKDSTSHLILGSARRSSRGSAWIEARLGSRLGLARGSAWLEARLGSRLGLARGSAWLEARLGSRLGLARGSAWLETRLGSRLDLWLEARLMPRVSAYASRLGLCLEARLMARSSILGSALFEARIGISARESVWCSTRDSARLGSRPG